MKFSHRLAECCLPKSAVGEGKDKHRKPSKDISQHVEDRKPVRDVCGRGKRRQGGKRLTRLLYSSGGRESIGPRCLERRISQIAGPRAGDGGNRAYFGDLPGVRRRRANGYPR